MVLFFPEHMGVNLLFVLMVTIVCVVFCFYYGCVLYSSIGPKAFFRALYYLDVMFLKVNNFLL